jgi:hypothetical protein
MGGGAFLPNGPSSNVQRNSLPYSKDFLVHVNFSQDENIT